MAVETQTTRARLQECALRLFAERGYAATSVADVARAAGVSHMTFFRHFPTKESVVVGDVFDPLIAEVVAAQPADLPALDRAAGGILAALDNEDARAELATHAFRQRIRLASDTPALRPAVWASGQETQTAIAMALTSTGSDAAASLAAAAAVIGAATAVLLDWAASDGDDTAEGRLRAGLSSLIGSRR